MQYRARGRLLVEPRLDMLTEQLMGLAGDEEAQELLMMVSDSEVRVPADVGVEMQMSHVLTIAPCSMRREP